LLDLAKHIRDARVTHASSPLPPANSRRGINPKWIDCFKQRRPEIKGIYASQLEYARKEGATYENVKRWFDAVAAMYEHSYDPCNIWNMDESGFGIGEEQIMKVLVYLDARQKEQVIGGKQEWVTDIECINAAGEALPPRLIFRGQDINTRWVNE
jgi:hypothetical protein